MTTIASQPAVSRVYRPTTGLAVQPSLAGGVSKRDFARSLLTLTAAVFVGASPNLPAQVQAPTQTSTVTTVAPTYIPLSGAEAAKDKAIEAQIAKLAELEKMPIPEPAEGTFYSKALLDKQNENYKRKLDEAGFDRLLNAGELKAALSVGIKGPNGKMLILKSGNNSNCDLVHPSMANNFAEEITFLSKLEKDRKKRLGLTNGLLAREPNNEEAKRYKILLAREGTLYKNLLSIYSLAEGIEVAQDLPKAKERYDALKVLLGLLGVEKNTAGHWSMKTDAQKDAAKYISSPDGILQGTLIRLKIFDYFFAHYGIK